MENSQDGKSFSHRKNLRLPDFDYSQNGAYFITIVTSNRMNFFGKIGNGEMILNDAGEMIDDVCRKISWFIPHVEFSLHQVMPNHLHTIVVIEQGLSFDKRNIEDHRQIKFLDGNEQLNLSTGGLISLSQVIQRFKSFTTHLYIEGVIRLNWPRFENRLWQRNYYEHVIRNERDHEAIADYILCNPQNWEEDKEFNG